MHCGTNNLSHLDEWMFGLSGVLTLRSVHIVFHLRVGGKISDTIVRHLTDPSTVHHAVRAGQMTMTNHRAPVKISHALRNDGMEINTISMISLFPEGYP